MKCEAVPCANEASRIVTDDRARRWWVCLTHLFWFKPIVRVEALK